MVASAQHVDEPDPWLTHRGYYEGVLDVYTNMPLNPDAVSEARNQEMHILQTEKTTRLPTAWLRPGSSQFRRFG